MLGEKHVKFAHNVSDDVNQHNTRTIRTESTVLEDILVEQHTKDCNKLGFLVPLSAW